MTKCPMTIGIRVIQSNTNCTATERCGSPVPSIKHKAPENLKVKTRDTRHVTIMTANRQLLSLDQITGRVLAV